MCYDQFMGQVGQLKGNRKTNTGAGVAEESDEDEEETAASIEFSNQSPIQNAQVVIRALQRSAMSQGAQAALSAEILAVEDAPSEPLSPTSQQNRAFVAAGAVAERAAQQDILTAK